MLTTVDYYTDGACSPNPGKGGWAWIRVEDGIITARDGGAKICSTNQVMELTAVYNACADAFARGELDAASFSTTLINIHTDSAYVHNCWRQEWWRAWQSNGWVNSKKEPVANKELWECLIPFFIKLNVNICKVAGHSGDKYNEIVDNLAVEYRKNIKGDNNVL